MRTDCCGLVKLWIKIIMQLLLMHETQIFRKIMWSEVKSRNKFLTINKNNEVHLFDLNSFYILCFFLSRCVLFFILFHVCVARIHRITAVYCCDAFTQVFIKGNVFFATCTSRRLSNTMEKFSGYCCNLRPMIQIIKTNSPTYL